MYVQEVICMFLGFDGFYIFYGFSDRRENAKQNKNKIKQD